MNSGFFRLCLVTTRSAVRRVHVAQETITAREWQHCFTRVLLGPNSNGFAESDELRPLSTSTQVTMADISQFGRNVMQTQFGLLHATVRQRRAPDPGLCCQSEVCPIVVIVGDVIRQKPS